MTTPRFHVRHNARPILIREVLEILYGRDIQTLDDILDIGRQRGYQTGTHVLSSQSLKENPIQSARELGLIDLQALTLTELGVQVVSLLRYKPSIWSETLHALHYTLWTPTRSSENCFSWSYRTTCDMLWERGSAAVDRGQLAAQVIEVAMERFGTTRVSFSRDSVRGILQWLEELDPPVLRNESKIFARRNFCSPELLALAVDHLYRLENADYQTNLLLDAEKEETICKACLIDPTAFDEAVNWAAGQFDFLQHGGSRTWGSYILLTRQPQIRDFLG